MRLPSPFTSRGLLLAASFVLSIPAWADACTGPPALEAKLRAARTPQLYAELGAWFDGHTQFACAVDAYRLALKLEPRSAAVLDGLARTYIAQADYTSAIDLLRHAPPGEALILDLASAYDRSGNTQAAGTTLVEAVRAHPSSARLTSALVLLMANHGQLDEAYGLAEKFAKLHPGDLNAQKLHLRVLVATNDPAAGALARKLLAAAPADGELLYLNGVLERKAGDAAAARDHLRRSVAITPSFADSRYNLGLALQQLGDANGAKEQLQAAISLGFADPDARLNLSKVLRSLGETGAADEQLKLYQSAIKAKGDHEMAASKSADAEAALGKGDAAAAVALYREALEVTPADATLQYKLSLALDRAGDTAAERKALEEAVRLDPSLALAQHQLGYLLSQAGDNDAAVEHFRLAVHADPGFTQAWINLAATLAMRSDFPEARDAVNQALRLDPHNLQAQEMKRMLPVSQASH